MNILLITTVFPSPLTPNKGAFNDEMVRALASEHRVKVIAPVSWTLARDPQLRRAALDRRSEHGAEIYHPWYFYTPKMLRGWYAAFLWQSIRQSVTRALSGFAPDVIVGYWAFPDGAVAVRLARRLRVPSVVAVGGTDVLVLGRDRARRVATTRALDRADAVVTFSRDLKRALTTWGIDPGRVSVIYRGVDGTRFAPGDRAAARARLGLPAGRRELLWVGHMVPVKSIDVLLDGCAAAARRVDFHLTLIGDGPLRRALEARCRAVGISDRVSFRGYVAHDELPDWYRAADLTVLSSSSEGVPNALLESIACGTPFVASNVGGVPEIADPLLDRLVRSGDPQAFGDAIVEALVSPVHTTRRVAPSTLTDSNRALIRLLHASATRSGVAPAVRSAAVSADLS